MQELECRGAYESEEVGTGNRCLTKNKYDEELAEAEGLDPNDDAPVIVRPDFVPPPSGS